MKRRIARLLVCGLLVQSLLGNAAVTRAEELPVTEAAEEQELTTNTPHQTEEETEDSGEKPEEEQPGNRAEPERRHGDCAGGERRNRS